eukprot:358772-Chlamydomonas_euryale.AAC.4
MAVVLARMLRNIRACPHARKIRRRMLPWRRLVSDAATPPWAAATALRPTGVRLAPNEDRAAGSWQLEEGAGRGLRGRGAASRVSRRGAVKGQEGRQSRAEDGGNGLSSQQNGPYYTNHHHTSHFLARRIKGCCFSASCCW